MKYSIDKQERYSLVTLHEEKLDTTLAPKLKSELITLHAEGVKNIVLDVSEVKYIDSSGLSSLLVGNRILTEDGGIFVIASPTEHVQKLIKISQLDNVLNILPSREEAIDAVFMNEIENDLNSGENLN
ncbi:sulfate transporter/antisigma-factor antagonist stas [Flammeovirgaceae bacterium 311]|uniref:STAS domain-containing protein n=1 Tax=Cesiribacter sp. SM1 TaxID=2861196 RepID=UPI0005D7D41F|nr:STAS domain-containing protein [Cesiribacter sp. SM1]AHM59946.1 sulfate transporter/antisigma-factor antagonist stas [Flammeovirgaceae bacterium 311]